MAEALPACTVPSLRVPDELSQQREPGLREASRLHDDELIGSTVNLHSGLGEHPSKALTKASLLYLKWES